MRILIVASILLASVGLAAVAIWQAEVHQGSLRYVLGGGMVVIGAGFFILHLSVSDEYLRKHFGGEENASRMRQLWRGGWVGVLIGAVTIAAEFFLGAGR